MANAGNTDSTISLFSEKRKYIALNAPIKAGEKLTFKFNVDIDRIKYKVPSFTYEDDMLNICVAGENAALASVIVEKHEKLENGKIEGVETANVNNGTTMWIVTDSTSCDYPAMVPYFALQSYGGVGQAFPKYMPENISVVNEGTRGLSAINKDYLNYCKLKPGDYLYLAYGHNHNDADEYYNCLQTYYDKAVQSNAKFIIASPINRHNSGDFDTSTNMWKEGFTAYSEKAEQFVKEKIDEGADNIAFVNLNKFYTEWMNTESERINTLNPNISKDRAMDFYYYSSKGSKVDGTHLNDAGADQGAYAFFKAMQNMVTVAATDSADKYELTQAEVVRPLVEGMKTKVGNSNTPNIPITVSEEIVKAGKAPNNYWDKIPSADVEYINSATISDVAVVTNNEDKSMTISSVTMRLMNSIETYAKARITVTDSEGDKKYYYTESNFDCTGDAAGGEYTLDSFITADKGRNDITDADKTAAITIPSGSDCVIDIVSCNDDGGVGNEPVIYSTAYNVYPENAALFTDGINALATGWKISSVGEENTADTTADDSWKILSGASSYSASLMEEGGEKYIKVVSEGDRNY